jgi:hypothetical protein
LSFFDLRHQIAPFVIFLLVIILVVILRPTVSDCPFCHFSFGHYIGSYSSTYGIRLPLLSFFFWSLYWLSFFDLRHQIAPFVIFLLVLCHFGIFMMNTLVISLSVLVWLVCHFGIFTPFLHISRHIHHRIYFLSIIISFTSTNYTKSHLEC